MDNSNARSCATVAENTEVEELRARFSIFELSTLTSVREPMI